MAAYHYFPNSYWSRCVSLLIAEKGLSPRRCFVDIRTAENFEPAYMRLNPKGVVPTWVEEGRGVCNGVRIAAHLDQVGGPALFTGLGEPEVERWVQRLDGLPMMLLCYSVWIKGLKGERSAAILDDKVERARRYAQRYPELEALYRRKQTFFEAFRAEVYDGARVAAETERSRQLLEQMAVKVAAEGWLAAGRYTFADAIATSALYRVVDLELLDEWHAQPDHPLAVYFDKLKRRPSFAAVFRDDPLLGR